MKLVTTATIIDSQLKETAIPILAKEIFDSVREETDSKRELRP